MSGGSGRVGLTLVGEVVGGYFFGPIGASIGGMIGSTIGGAIWPEQIEGPKLEGLQVTSSAYGGPIPDVYGTVRIGGNIIWASEIRETATTEAQGKGGGPELTKYTYSVDLAIALCAGPVVGIRRMWADQKLIFDVGSDNPASIYAAMKKGGEGMTFYIGTDDQLPDPTIEAALGVGATPAYRDLCYVVLADFQLGEYGNRVPNITVEVVAGGTDSGPRMFFQKSWDVPVQSTSGVRIAQIGGEMVTLGGLGEIAYISDLEGEDTREVPPRQMPTWPPNAVFTDAPAAFAYGAMLLWPPQSDALAADVDVTAAVYTLTLPAINNLTQRNTTYIAAGGLTGTDYSDVLSDGGNYVYSLIPCADREHVLVMLTEADNGELPTYWVLFSFNGFVFSEERRGTVASGFLGYRTGGAMSSHGGTAFTYSAAMLESDLQHVWFASGAGTREILLASLETGEMTQVIAFSATAPAPHAFGRFNVYADNSVCWVASSDGGSSTHLYAFTRAPNLNLSVTLDEVVADICDQAGLLPGDINVTDLSDTEVRGYLRTPRMTARAAIEPLITAYAFDAVESDLKIKYVMRNADSVVTIPADDLGAADGEIGTPVLVDSERAQESELPVAIDVSYMAVQADYQIGTQTVRRQVTDSIEQNSLRIALALEDQEAAEICARMIYELWLARNTRKFTTTIKYTKYEPTDVVDIESDAATYRVRIIDKQEKGNLIAWTGVDVDAAAFDPTATGQEVPPGGQTVTLPGLTQAIAADLPPLRDVDFGHTGYYAAGAGYSTPWPGAILYRKGETATEYAAEMNLLTAATMGGTLAAVGAHGSYVPADGQYIYAGYYPDHINTVEVALTAGSLSSCTDAEFLEFQNVALVGSEIIAFRDVEATGDNTYVLSCLLRGVLGTEWFAKLDPATRDPLSVQDILNGLPSPSAEQVQGHRVGDRFMLLDETFVQRFDSQSATTRLQGKVKAVTSGDTLANTGSSDMQTTYASIVPPHPTHMSGYMDGTNMVLDFNPRTFVGGGWEDGADVWIDPAYEKYVADIYTADASKYVFLTGTPPFTILNTDLPGDGGPYSLRVATIPPQKGVAAFGEDPFNANRHWSRFITVS